LAGENRAPNYLAEDAAELVSVEADDLTPILDASAAPGSFAPDLSTDARCCAPVTAMLRSPTSPESVQQLSWVTA
jgi:hypothetical protein